MTDYISKINLDLNCCETPVVLSAGQFDVGRKIEVSVTADGASYDVTGCTAVCKGINFAIECEIDSENNKVIITTDENMLSVRGTVAARLTLFDGTRSYSTQSFVILIKSAFEGDVTQSNAYSILNSLINRVLQITETGGILVDTTLDENSANPVRNSVLTEAINSKADKATTLAGYGITDAYTKAQVNSQLANKLSNSDGSVFFRHLNAADVIANQIQGGNTKLVRSTDVYTALSQKANASTVSEGLSAKVDVADVITGFDKLLSNPDKIPTALAVKNFLSGYYYSIDESYNSDEVDTALAQKYDASNVETGSGTLECVDETLADKLTATFKYQKIGKFCLLDIQIKATEKIENDVMFDGLPFVAKSASYNACSSNYGDIRSLIVPYNNTKLKLIGGITTTTTVAITVIYRIEN